MRLMGNTTENKSRMIKPAVSECDVLMTNLVKKAPQCVDENSSEPMYILNLIATWLLVVNWIIPLFGC